MANPTSSDQTLADFGANEWLVEEMRERFDEDPTSVDPTWRTYFEDHALSSNDGGAAPASATPDATPARPPVAPAPRVAPATPRAGAQVAPAPPREPQAAPAPKAAPAVKAAPSAAPAKPPATAQKATTPSAGAPQKASTTKETHVSRDTPTAKKAGPQTEGVRTPLRGAVARVVTNMESSLEVPTATSARNLPAKLLIDNRIVINNHLARSRGGKVSFTHLIGYAMVRAAKKMPEMNNSFDLVEGKPTLVQPAHINLGLAIDVPKPDGTRQLLVPNIKGAEAMSFYDFWAAYEEVVKKARDGKLTIEDFVGTTISLTNPGGIGTLHSVPRLMKGQGTIVGVGALDYPAEWQGASPERIASNAVSKIVTLTSTYDHRVIQGAQSGEFLQTIHQLLLGADGFYDNIFRSLRIPYEPIRWAPDITATHDDDISKASRTQELIRAYRVRGHLMADTDPLTYVQRRHEDLAIESHGLTLWDLDRDVATGGFGGQPRLTLRKILGILRDSYCRTVGVEYMHIQDPTERAWFQDKLEAPFEKPAPSEQLRILRRLNAAEAFETFLQTKFVGQKRFSLEGGESVIALLDKVLNQAADDGLAEVTIGMPHRGRLNVLANLAGKSYGQIFREFEGAAPAHSAQGSGDVKYHLGTEGEFVTDHGQTTRVYLAANPSHLEAVNPVLEGISRAKQDKLELETGINEYPVLPVLLHGDAAFAGQGVVLETLQMSQLPGYRVGGTIHVVVNNQVGFTTAPQDSRTSVYCTDVARAVQAPVLHVNGDDPEAVVRVAEIAYDYRQTFHKDVVIDMVCYRRRGHNEGDDPSMTQPLMYDLIDAKRSVRKLYTESLIGRGDITVDEAEEALRDYQKQLEQVFIQTKKALKGEGDGTGGLERPQSQNEGDVQTRQRPTAITSEMLQRIGDAFVDVPEGFTVHPKLAKLLTHRQEMTREGGIDWAMGELIAFGSSLMDGTPVRLSGQDSRRGTFVQRHAVLTDHETADTWTPLQHLSADQAYFQVYDSLLSEYAVMGFEYGYSVERPDTLVLWEAQFGDFANGAQTIVDEFISSSEQKWDQRSSIVLLLPHGYEGQGPDHSSARIERYLSLCAEDNMIVAYPSTPASYFHLLRKQALARPRKPLVVFTPKAMLRLKAGASAPEDFLSGTFEPVLADRADLDRSAVDRVLIASSKLVYDLEEERRAKEDTATAIIRMEQLYPAPGAQLAAITKEYPNAELVWAQNEPANQGAWPFMALNLPQDLAQHGETRPLRLVSRRASAAPSTGSGKVHTLEQETLLHEAFARG
ncbi:MAG: multifunctional oxoglutarate decarboxylase/oxoglutarate dehydrogenase thiamine pyrophosphate-binding subunit/dihydrolipoyllysine-residue succinyltransferase subunit [Ornithinimicrobium sp.]|uniref:multifunctional oxoglutarate decarboxylase/oxoglutarate dehydrogenase thiamine pyrophosphate-binding subunit/dihydrolipoyllysine-residue succinyltransferase subunit n=1 Tax=Ornithinimicrobium sp. TaxID=1977084 RepID=UPI0026DF5F83|nr:multifunctional oxoglutarate decarboxylase/oxoglutarate dehydrogenase thiamine pyrophosphate-binding subunit/dihydrolipoyllysine-residue succinyltransferase subunit [Ornithinimicrobium sp.]MDO5739807.1 multifunctional oxoglutarate decarboxylase/oxoglutarate dehydrogenase thiamine pyrophosphate-binding subunit/dihydrolipoyllysine-residue succinyltransferase subunit [Ornithinimicrobium sp.]